MSSDAPSYGLANFKGLLPSILATGVGGGMLSAYMTGRTPERPGEDPAERRNRIIRNAAVGALLSGSATGLGGMAFRNISKAAPPMSPAVANLMDPETKGGLWDNGIGAGLGAALGASAPVKGNYNMKQNWGARGYRGGLGGALGFLAARPLSQAFYHTVLPATQN